MLVMVGGVNTSVQCVDLLLEVIPGPQWTTAFGSIYISRTGPSVGNDDEGEIERRGRGDYQTSEGVDERVGCES